MGLDIYIMKYKNRRTPNEASQEVYYARKFWNLLDANFVRGYQDDCVVHAPIRGREDMDELIQIAVREPDYFGEYNTVPKLCKIRDEIDSDIENGWSYYLEADW